LAGSRANLTFSKGRMQSLGKTDVSVRRYYWNVLNTYWKIYQVTFKKVWANPFMFSLFSVSTSSKNAGPDPTRHSILFPNQIHNDYSLDRYHPAVASTHLYKKSLEDILKTSDESTQSWLRSVDAALTGYRIRVPTDLTPRNSHQLWRGILITTRLRCLHDNNALL
jgi:hypothetical protein